MLLFTNTNGRPNCAKEEFSIYLRNKWPLIHTLDRVMGWELGACLTSTPNYATKLISQWWHHPKDISSRTKSTFATTYSTQLWVRSGCSSNHMVGGESIWGVRDMIENPTHKVKANPTTQLFPTNIKPQ